jgi:hypothetical protein
VRASWCDRATLGLIYHCRRLASHPTLIAHACLLLRPDLSPPQPPPPPPPRLPPCFAPFPLFCLVSVTEKEHKVQELTWKLEQEARVSKVTQQDDIDELEKRLQEKERRIRDLEWKVEDVRKGCEVELTNKDQLLEVCMRVLFLSMAGQGGEGGRVCLGDGGGGGGGVLG